MALHRPHLTRRGWGVVTVVVVALWMGWAFGGRSLNAVVVPALAALVLGGLSVAHAARPDVQRRVADAGHVGDTLSATLQVDGSRLVALTVADDLPTGARGDAAFETVGDGRDLRYEFTLRKRGVHAVGPAAVTMRDFLGLWERTVHDSRTEQVVAYPRVHPLHESAELLSGYVGLTDRREQFDSIREYQRGDALRDVNWKASAKREGDLYVTEFAGEGAHNRVRVGVSAAKHRADSAAEAGASVAAYLLDAGLSVGVVTPADRVEPAVGDDHRRQIFDLLARFEGGARTLPDDVDVVVHAPTDGTHVRLNVEGGAHRFAELVSSPEAVVA